MEKVTFELWEAIQDNNFSRCEELILEGADLNYQLQAHGSVPPPPPYYRLTVRVYYFPEYYQVRSTRLYAMLSIEDTILHICAREGYLESVRWLLKKNVDLTLRNDRNKTALDVATPEVKEIFAAYFAGNSTLTIAKPIQDLPVQEYARSFIEERWSKLQQLLTGDPTSDIPQDFFASWPLHESLRATQLLRQSRGEALELKRQAFNAKLKLLKQSQSNLAILKERRMAISRTIQDLQLQISAAEKQLNVVEVEEFRSQRETDELKAEYANESNQFGRLQKAKDKVLQITAPLMNHWQEWRQWCEQHQLAEFTLTDTITLLRVLDVDVDIEAAIQLNFDGKVLESATHTLLKNQLKIFPFGDRKRILGLVENAKNESGVHLPKEGELLLFTSELAWQQPRGWRLLPPQEWTFSEVAEWVAVDINIRELRDTFQRHKISGQQLVKLTEEELREELGIQAPEHRNHLLGAIKNVVSVAATRKREIETPEAEPNKRFKEAPNDPIPQEYLCKLNFTLMEDPVLATDGYTYERAAITQWLEKSDVSPITGQPLVSKQVFPNHSLKGLIAAYLSKRS